MVHQRLKSKKADLHLIEQSEEQKMLSDNLHSWAQTTILPYAQHWDEEQELPIKVLREAEELGLHSISVKESLGGSEMGLCSCSVCSRSSRSL